MIATGFMLSEKECAKKNWVGFLIKTKLECEKNFKWLTFTIKNGKLLGKGSLTENGNKYDFTIFCSPFFRGRFERVIVESKKLKRSVDTHFNGDGTLCLYHPVYDLHQKPFVSLVDVIPWLSEWVYLYEKYLEFNVWLGPEYPHNIK